MRTEYVWLLIIAAVLLGIYFVTNVNHCRQPSPPEKFTTPPDEDVSDMEIIRNPDDADEIRLDSSQGTFGYGRAGNSFFV